MGDVAETSEGAERDKPASTWAPIVGRVLMVAETVGGGSCRPPAERTFCKLPIALCVEMRPPHQLSR